jgi:COP9 signalosome complex subunit 1
LGNYVLLSQYIGKAEGALNLKELDVVADSIIKVSTGLYNLELKKYKVVAKKMIETPTQFEDKMSEIFSSQDVGNNKK